MMEEAAAIAIADKLARSECVVPLDRTSARKLDTATALDYFEGLWRDGTFDASQVKLEDLQHAIRQRFRRPRWVVIYSGLSSDPDPALVTVTVSIDEETAASTCEVHVHHRRPK